MKLAELALNKSAYPLRSDQAKQANLNSVSGQNNQSENSGKNFSEVLNQRIDNLHNLKFSAHATSRMNSRNIQPSESELLRLTNGVDKARENGSNSSLILVDEMAYVVSVKNQTVITALNKAAAQGNVFSNIDSVAIV